MPQFRKKPVVIEAIQWEASHDSWNEIKAMGCPTEPGEMGSKSFYIPTLEGKMKAQEGDWIIKGVNGEFYPCKNEIFEKTYEAATEIYQTRMQGEEAFYCNMCKDMAFCASNKVCIEAGQPWPTPSDPK